jgi:hypothetical protein
LDFGFWILDWLPMTNDHRQIWKISLALGAGVGLIYLAFLKPGIWGIDGNEMFWMSHSLVTEGNLSLPPGAGIQGRGGEYYSSRYPLISILAAPFTAIGLAFGYLMNLPTRYSATLFALLLPLLLTAITTALVFGIALRLGSSKKGAYLAALSFAFGTTALVYAREFFAEPVLSLITAASLYWALGKDYREHAGASILAGLAVTAKPSGIIIGPILSLYFFGKRYPWRAVVSPLLGTGMGILLYLGYNYLRFENFGKTGQGTERIQWAGMAERWLGMLFSPGSSGGLFWYCPPTLLAIWGFHRLFKKQPLEALLVVAVFLGYLTMHSLWVFRGWNWGPRFLVPALPGLLALTALIPQKRWGILLALTFLGFFINAPTLVSYYQRYYAEAADTDRFLRVIALWGNPLDAPLFNAWPAAFRQLGDAFSHDVRAVINNVGEPAYMGELTKSDLLQIVAVWWWMLPAAGIPIWLGFIVAVALVVGGIWLLRWGWREI